MPGQARHDSKRVYLYVTGIYCKSRSDDNAATSQPIRCHAGLAPASNWYCKKCFALKTNELVHQSNSNQPLFSDERPETSGEWKIFKNSFSFKSLRISRVWKILFSNSSLTIAPAEST